MADYTLNNSMEQIDRAISGAYLALVVAGTGLMRVVQPPATATSSGASGYNVAFSEDYFYACTGTNLWGRIPFSTW